MSLSLTASVVTVNQSKFENHFFQEKFLIYLTKLENSSGFNSINSMPWQTCRKWWYSLDLMKQLLILSKQEERFLFYHICHNKKMSQDVETIIIIIHFQEISENRLDFLMTHHPGHIRNVWFIHSFTHSFIIYFN